MSEFKVVDDRKSSKRRNTSGRGKSKGSSAEMANISSSSIQQGNQVSAFNMSQELNRTPTQPKINEVLKRSRSAEILNEEKQRKVFKTSAKITPVNSANTSPAQAIVDSVMRESTSNSNSNDLSASNISRVSFSQQSMQNQSMYDDLLLQEQSQDDAMFTKQTDTNSHQGDLPTHGEKVNTTRHDANMQLIMRVFLLLLQLKFLIIHKTA